MAETPDKDHPRMAAKGGVHTPEHPGLGKRGAEVKPGKQTKHRRPLTSKQKWLIVGAVAGSVAVVGGAVAGVGYAEGWFGGSADQNPGSSTTSTTERPTTVPEAQTFESLINPNITYEGLINTPTIEQGSSYIMVDTVPESIKTQLGSVPVTWKGEYNTAEDQNKIEGNRFDDYTLNGGIDVPGHEKNYYGFGRFGSCWGTAWTNPETGVFEAESCGGLVMELTDKPFIRVPNSSDIILQGRDPITEELYYARIVMGEAGSIAYCFDIVNSQPNSDDLFVLNSNSEMADNYLNELTLEEFRKVFKPNTIVNLMMFGEGGNNIDPTKWATDENNIPLVRLALFWGDTVRANEINGIMNHVETPTVTQTTTRHQAILGEAAFAFEKNERAAA